MKKQEPMMLGYNKAGMEEGAKILKNFCKGMGLLFLFLFGAISLFILPIVGVIVLLLTIYWGYKVASKK